MRYITSVCVALSVPALAIALSQVTRERKEQLQRSKHLDTQDALTGLLTRTAFEGYLGDALQRVRAEAEAVALVVVRLVNYRHVAAAFGTHIGEQSEVRAVVKLHSVLRDVDPAGRIDTGRYALLL